jgi:uncharacterized protein YceH (UPF0502 family)
MITLTPDEARVLGVLIEKSLTTPNQYPLSLNAVVDGANQKSNRDPVLNMTEDQAFDALESLRAKQLVVRVDQMGARVHKFKHAGVEVLHARTAEVAILAELLLRGPQTLGELRGRASRMQPMESLERVRDMIRALSERPEPYVKELPPAPGSRAERYVQLLCPDLHPVDAPVGATAAAAVDGYSLSDRVEKLEAEVESLKFAVSKLAQAMGEPDPLIEAEGNVPPS